MLNWAKQAYLKDLELERAPFWRHLDVFKSPSHVHHKCGSLLTNELFYESESMNVDDIDDSSFKP